MVQVKLKSQVTADDLEELRRIYRDLQKLTVGLNPSAQCHAPLYACIATVQACGADWSGNPHIWRATDPIGR